MADKRNRWIILLLILGIVSWGIEAGVKVQFQREQQQYQLAQLNPLTNDFTNITKFKNPYMGNNSNDAALNAALPLANVPHTFLIHPQTRDLEIRYQQSVQQIGMAEVQSSLLYNATANFTLVGNLSSITFVFPGATYHVTRSQVQTWYDVNPAKLNNKDAWRQSVQSKLANRSYVSNAFHAFFKTAD